MNSTGSSKSRIALFWAYGPYPLALYRTLTSIPHLDVVAVSPDAEMVKSFGIPCEQIADFSSLRSACARLNAPKILFSGDFDYLTVRENIPRLASQILTDWRSVFALGRSGFFNPCSRYYLSGNAFLRALDWSLSRWHIEIVTPHEFTDIYRGKEGENGSKAADVLIQFILQELKNHLAPQQLAVSQSHIFCADKKIVSETSNTHELLSRFKAIWSDQQQRPEVERTHRSPVLIKLPVPDINPKLDLPFIGPDTIRDCVDSGVRGIIFCTEDTILYEKRALITVADQYDFFLTGISRREMNEVMKM